jgi:catechol 2,3-dioxygenase-like lactoylglutathione lyase family enzyme
MSVRNDDLELVLTGWIDARRRNDLETIERHLHPDVVWQGLRPDLICGNRAAVVDNVRSNDGWLPEVSGIELHADGDQVMLGVRSPDLTEIAGERLDGEIYNVFTIADELIVRIDEYRTRDDALDAMQARLVQAIGPQQPLRRTPPAPVEDLIPFAHVADVERSIAFYELLGFAVTATHGPPDRLGWAALEHEQARLMLARADRPPDPAGQGVLFYLYTRDVHALQTHLRAHGQSAGPIRDGTPGPRQEMRVRDPDGYMLMVAQRDEH